MYQYQSDGVPTLANERGRQTLCLNISVGMKRSYVKLLPTMYVDAYVEVIALTLAVNIDDVLVLGTEIESLAVILNATYELIIEEATVTTVSNARKSQA